MNNDSVRFKDIDADGVPEIEIDSDGGGNRPACFHSYYCWTDNTFRQISFSGIEDGRASCESWHEEYKAGIKRENNRTFYVSYAWRYMYPQARDEAANLSMKDKPLEARLCKNVETTYEYDSGVGVFTKIAEQTIEENRDTLEDGIVYYCY